MLSPHSYQGLATLTSHGNKLTHNVCSWMATPDICSLAQTSKDLRQMRNHRTRVVLNHDYPVHDLGLLYHGLLEVRVDNMATLERVINYRAGGVIKTRSMAYSEDCASKTMRNNVPITALETVISLDISNLKYPQFQQNIKQLFPKLQVFKANRVIFRRNEFNTVVNSLPDSIEQLYLQESSRLGYGDFTNLPTTNLKIINLDKTILGPPEITSISTALDRSEMLKLEELYVGKLHASSIDDCIKLYDVISAKAPNLKILKLSDMSIQYYNRAMRTAVASVITNCPAIENLDINLGRTSIRVTNQSMIQMISDAKDSFPKLKYLCFRGTVDNESLGYVARIASKAVNLEALLIMGDIDSSFSWKTNDLLRAAPNLKKLRLQGAVTSVARKALSVHLNKLKCLENLQVVNFANASTNDFYSILPPLSKNVDFLQISDFSVASSLDGHTLLHFIYTHTKLKTLLLHSSSIDAAPAMWVTNLVNGLQAPGTAPTLHTIKLPLCSETTLLKVVSVINQGAIPSLRSLQVSTTLWSRDAASSIMSRLKINRLPQVTSRLLPYGCNIRLILTFTV